jgi:hypothetical protein
MTPLHEHGGDAHAVEYTLRSRCSWRRSPLARSRLGVILRTVFMEATPTQSSYPAKFMGAKHTNRSAVLAHWQQVARIGRPRITPATVVMQRVSCTTIITISSSLMCNPRSVSTPATVAMQRISCTTILVNHQQQSDVQSPESRCQYPCPHPGNGRHAADLVHDGHGHQQQSDVTWHAVRWPARLATSIDRRSWPRPRQVARIGRHRHMPVPVVMQRISCQCTTIIAISDSLMCSTVNG